MITKDQLAFGEALRQLREAAGFATGRAFAAVLGWQPSKVSRIETGATLPTDGDVVAWTAAARVSDTARETLRDQLRDLRLARASWRRRLRTGHSPEQAELRRRESKAKHLVQVEFFVVPGLIQTAEYARAVFVSAAELHDSVPDTDAAVAERIRRQEVLYDPAVRVDVLIGESALRYPIASPAVMAGQLDRIAGLTGLPGVRVGVIPLDVRLQTITLHGFEMIDSVVTVEINHSEVIVSEPDEVALYRRIVDGLWSSALVGDEARAHLAGLASRLGL